VPSHTTPADPTAYRTECPQNTWLPEQAIWRHSLGKAGLLDHCCCRFALIASNIPLSSAVSVSPQPAADVSISSSALQQLLPAGGGAAQAASLDAADQAHAALQPVLTNPILQLDDAIHQYVATHTTKAFRLMADVFISDAFITAGIFGWVACTAACLTKAPSRSAGPLAAAWALYCATCGAVGHGDPLLVDSLKHLFARARPSTLHHTFSFPSGHTSAAVFIVGGLLTVLLPLTLQLWTEQPPSSSSSSDPTTGAIDGNNSSSSSSSSKTQSSQPAGTLATDVAILAVWGAAWATTAAGRILSESHWLSDTLAGGLLAVASVSGMACCTKLLLDASSSSSSTAATDSTSLH